MTPDEFRQAGYAAVDWVASYMERLEELPVLSQVAPGEIRSRLPARPPDQGEPFEAILGDLDGVVLPGITHWQSPSFFGYFPGNASGPAILGDLISSGIGAQGMLWSTSPACTELETHVLDWLADMLGLPERFKSSSAGGGVVQDTASSAVLCAVIAARERATNGSSNATGVDRTFTAYTSSQAHSSIVKAVGAAGVGRDNLRLIDVDDSYAMRPDALERAIASDLEQRHTPFLVCATVGTTSSTAIDPVRTIGMVARRHGLWLHVDAALAGTAALCEEFRWMHDGIELADSYSMNPHKWMLTNLDFSAFYVADRAALTGALSVTPEYLRNKASETGRVVDYRDWHLPLGRRFRALKLWFVIRHYGVRALQERIREHMRLAQEFASWIDESNDFELAAPTPLNLVCFRHRGGDDASRRIMDSVNASGRLFLTHTKLDGRLILRVAIGGTYTERRHVQRAWDAIRAAAEAVA